MSDVFDSSTGENATSVIEQLVGEGKKYKTVEDLAKGRIEADQFIEQLKGEGAELRKELQARDDLVKALQAKLAPSGSTETKTLDPNAVAELVNTVLDKRTAEQRRKDNLDAAVGEIVSVLGSREAAKEAIAKRAAELGVTPQYLREQAEASPVAFKQLMQIQAPKQETPSTTKGTSTATPKPTGVKNATYFNALRKELGPKFYDSKIQNEMFKARKELGDAFYQ